MNNKIALPRLSEVSDYDSISCPSKAIRRGMHCPLFGCTLIMKYINDMAFLIVGTDECGFYSKEILKVTSENYLISPVYTYAVEEYDVIYGCSEKIINSLKEIQQQEKPSAICVISTCVPELIGEDLKGVIKKAQSSINTSIIYCTAHNFKENSHVDGMSDLLECFTQIMEKQNKVSKTVNIIGYRDDDIINTELYQHLMKNNIKITTSIPECGSVLKLKSATSASLNIVVDPIGLKLAKKMKEMFNIPYVVFGKYADPEKIMNSYKKIWKVLDIKEDKELILKEQELINKWNELKIRNDKVSFVYCNSRLISIDLVMMLVKYGFEAKAVYVISKNDFDREEFDKLKKYNTNPYMMMLTDFSVNDLLVENLKPTLFIGQMREQSIEEYNVKNVSTNEVESNLGFCLSKAMLDAINTALNS